MLSPLRYPGSKRRLTGYIQQVLQLNDLRPALFIEPFAGGASVALNLLEQKVVEQIGLVEKDPLVASFWQIVFSQKEEDVAWLLNWIRTVEVTVERWNAYKGWVPDEVRQRAMVCLYLNRTSFSGILAPGAGPIGGQTQASDYPIDCRFPRERLIQRIEQAAQLSHRVAFVWEMDWAAALTAIHHKQTQDELPHDVVYYLDPPFFEKAERLYTHHFTAEDHIALRDALAALEEPWILSYDDCDRVHELYEDSERTHVELLYSASANGGGRKAKEAIVTNLQHFPKQKRLWRTSEERRQERPDANLPNHELDEGE